MHEEFKHFQQNNGEKLSFFFVHCQIDGTILGPEGKEAFLGKTKCFPLASLPFGFLWEGGNQVELSVPRAGSQGCGLFTSIPATQLVIVD